MKRILLIITIFLSGCSFKQLPSMNTFNLGQANVNKVNYSKYKNKILKISYATSISKPLIDKMRYCHKNAECGYYLNNKWDSSVAYLLNGYIINSLQDANLFKSVIPYTSIAMEDLKLEPVVYSFYNLVEKNNSYAIVKIDFNLIDSNTNKLIKNKTFTIKKLAPSINAQGYASATKRALNELSKKLIRWINN